MFFNQQDTILVVVQIQISKKTTTKNINKISPNITHTFLFITKNIH